MPSIAKKIIIIVLSTLVIVFVYIVLSPSNSAPVASENVATDLPASMQTTDNLESVPKITNQISSNDSQEAATGWRSRYKDTTLDEIMSFFASNDYADFDGKFPHISFINAKSTVEPYKVEMIYKNQYRKVSPQKKEFLNEWGGSMNVSPEIIALYEEEVLFTNGGKEYWMLIQSPLVPYLKNEAAYDGPVKLLIMHPGAYSEYAEFNWVFIINEFSA